MRTLLLSTFVVLMTAAPVASAASTPPTSPGFVDALLGIIDTVFGIAEDQVDALPVDEGTKDTFSRVLKTRHDTAKNAIRNVR